jgi:acyl carrier protein
MTPSELEGRVLGVLLNVAPDVDAATLKREVAFREQFDFDSMDTLNFAIGLSRELGIDVPETAYGQLASLGLAIAFAQRQLKIPAEG